MGQHQQYDLASRNGAKFRRGYLLPTETNSLHIPLMTGGKVPNMPNGFHSLKSISKLYPLYFNILPMVVSSRYSIVTSMVLSSRSSRSSVVGLSTKRPLNWPPKLLIRATAVEHIVHGDVQ